MRVRDDLEQLPVAEVGVGHDQLVHALGLEDRGEVLHVAEHGQVEPFGRRRERAYELVVDPAARGAERAVQVRQVLARAGEQRVAACAQGPKQLAGDEVVARAQARDHDRAEEHSGRREPVGREVVPGADREGERDQRDQEQGREDPAEAGAPPALLVEPGLREDEHGDQGQEGQPVRLDAPEDAPEDRRSAVVELPGDQRGIEADDETPEVDADERGDAGEPPSRHRQLAAREEERGSRADVGDDPRGGFVPAVHSGGGDSAPPPLRCSGCHAS